MTGRTRTDLCFVERMCRCSLPDAPPVSFESISDNHRLLGPVGCLVTQAFKNPFESFTLILSDLVRQKLFLSSLLTVGTPKLPECSFRTRHLLSKKETLIEKRCPALASALQTTTSCSQPSPDLSPDTPPRAAANSSSAFLLKSHQQR
jgi:hypothetical protein